MSDKTRMVRVTDEEVIERMLKERGQTTDRLCLVPMTRAKPPKDRPSRFWDKAASARQATFDEQNK